MHRRIALSVSPGTLRPAFASTTTEYRTAVPNGTGQVTVTYT